MLAVHLEKRTQVLRPTLYGAYSRLATWCIGNIALGKGE